MNIAIAFAIGSAAVLAVVWLKGRFADFRSQKPEHYLDEGAEIDIRRHLNGPLLCEGVIYGPTGRVTSRFVADFNARWEGNTGTMTEHFKYESGRIQDRKWHLSLGNDGGIRAEADDLDGPGTGQQMGSAVVLNYRIKLPSEAGGYTLDTTDWMYLMDNGTIMNRSQFRKFGIKVAELVATMRPKEAA